MALVADGARSHGGDLHGPCHAGVNVMVWTSPARHLAQGRAVPRWLSLKTTSEGATSVGKSIINLSSVATVGLDLAKHVFQVHCVDVLN